MSQAGRPQETVACRLQGGVEVKRLQAILRTQCLGPSLGSENSLGSGIKLPQVLTGIARRYPVQDLPDVALPATRACNALRRAPYTHTHGVEIARSRSHWGGL